MTWGSTDKIKECAVTNMTIFDNLPPEWQAVARDHSFQDIERAIQAGYRTPDQVRIFLGGSNGR